MPPGLVLASSGIIAFAHHAGPIYQTKGALRDRISNNMLDGHSGPKLCMRIVGTPKQGISSLGGARNLSMWLVPPRRQYGSMCVMFLVARCHLAAVARVLMYRARLQQHVSLLASVWRCVRSPWVDMSYGMAMHAHASMCCRICMRSAVDKPAHARTLASQSCTEIWGDWGSRASTHRQPNPKPLRSDNVHGVRTHTQICVGEARGCARM